MAMLTTDSCACCCAVLCRATAASKAKVTAKKTGLAAGDDSKGWDGSTHVGDDDVGRMDKVDKGRVAEEVIRENPEMRSVHSRGSVRAMLQKVEQVSGVVAG